MKSSSFSPKTFPVTNSPQKSIRSILQCYTEYPKKELAKKQENEQSAQVDFFINEILGSKKQINECFDIITILND